MLLPWRRPSLQHLREGLKPGAELSFGELPVVHAVYLEIEDGDPDLREPRRNARPAGGEESEIFGVREHVVKHFC